MLNHGTFAEYAAGRLLSMARLLAAGVAGGVVLEVPDRNQAIRCAGGAIAAAGLLMIAGLV